MSLLKYWLKQSKILTSAESKVMFLYRFLPKIRLDKDLKERAFIEDYEHLFSKEVYSKDYLLFEEKKKNNGIYFIYEGAADMILPLTNLPKNAVDTLQENAFIIIQKLKRGDTIGEEVTLNDSSPYCVRVTSNEMTTLKITHESLLKFFGGCDGSIINEFRGRILNREICRRRLYNMLETKELDCKQLQVYNKPEQNGKLWMKELMEPSYSKAIEEAKRPQTANIEDSRLEKSIHLARLKQIGEKEQKDIFPSNAKTELEKKFFRELNNTSTLAERVKDKNIRALVTPMIASDNGKLKNATITQMKGWEKLQAIAGITKPSNTPAKINTAAIPRLSALPID